MKHQDDIFLSKWLNNQLSEDELNEFKSSEDYDTYVKIIEGTSKLKAPSYDLDKAFVELKAKRNGHHKTNRKWYQYGIAASVILLIGFISYFNFFNNTTYSSDFGEQIAFNLPDGSKVILNSKSTISFDESNWESNRTLELKGEAYFDVEKGNTFTVTTSQGDVSVLGTEFNVHAEKGFFEVSCYEGKVKVNDHKNKNVNYLIPNNGYRHIRNMKAVSLQFEELNPSWLEKHSTFKSLPIKYVFNALEKHYNIKIVYNNFDDTIPYTGTFPNNNKEIALETVLKSVNLKYTIEGNSVILQD